jgi:glycosyltransferase involved in cell wall biosynthesis
LQILLFGKYPPIQGGVSAATYWACRDLAAEGHDVHVVTNAAQVESSYRQFLSPEDTEKLEATGLPGSVVVHNIVPIKPFAYIPWAPPFVSQLLGLGVELLERSEFQIIIGWYYEPYAVAATILGSLSNLPVVVRHAGSDVARLARVPDLAHTYSLVHRKAEIVVTTRTSSALLLDLGVPSEKLRIGRGVCLPVSHRANTNKIVVQSWTRHFSDWIETCGLREAVVARLKALNHRDYTQGRPTIGTYGKVGLHKGSFYLIAALEQVARLGYKFDFMNIATGSPLQLNSFYQRLLECENLVASTWLFPPLAPWRIPEFLSTCDAVAFLEHKFPISIHRPGIPREILASSACLLCTTDIVENLPFRDSLVDGKNCRLIADVENVDNLARIVVELIEDTERTRVIGVHGKYLSQTIEAELPDRDSLVEIVRLFDESQSRRGPMKLSKSDGRRYDE